MTRPSLRRQENPFRPLGGKKDTSFAVHDDGMDIGKFFYQGEAFGGAKHKYRRGQGIRVHGRRGQDGDALALPGRHSSSRIQEVVISCALFQKKLFIIP